VLEAILNKGSLSPWSVGDVGEELLDFGFEGR
jgi:hypothetical protein